MEQYVGSEQEIAVAVNDNPEPYLEGRDKRQGSLSSLPHLTA